MHGTVANENAGSQRGSHNGVGSFRGRGSCGGRPDGRDGEPARPSARCRREAGGEDRRTRALPAGRLSAGAHRSIVEIPPGSPQTKPRSCNAGLLLTKGELLVVYDAEDRPARHQLRVVAESFLAGDASLACVQAKLAVSNARRSFVTRQFAIEYGGGEAAKTARSNGIFAGRDRRTRLTPENLS
jgi:hypothetical protein